MTTNENEVARQEHADDLEAAGDYTEGRGHTDAPRLRAWLVTRAGRGTEEFTLSDVCQEFGWDEPQAAKVLAAVRYLGHDDGYLLSYRDPGQGTYTFTRDNGAALAPGLNARIALFSQEPTP